MKSFIFLAALLLVCSFGRAQMFTYNQGGTTAKNYYEELPYETINGKIFIYVTIGDKKHKFLFDTGAPVAVSKELAAELKAPIIHKDGIIDANGTKDSVSVVELNDLKLGSVAFNHIPAITLFPEIYKCWNIDGVIGSNILRNSILSIAASKHLLILTDQRDKLTLNLKNGLLLNNNTDQQNTPVITIAFNDKVNFKLEFDTGDSGFLRITDDIINKLNKFKVCDTLAKGYGASLISGLGLQKNADKYLLKFPLITLGKVKFNNVITESNKEGIPGIGTKLLDYGDVTLDFIHGKFYFDAVNEVNDLNERQWPFKPTVAADKLVVGVVWDKASADLKPGRQIVAVDEQDYTQIVLCTLVNSKSPLYGKETAIITIKDEQGNLKKVTINKQ